MKYKKLIKLLHFFLHFDIINMKVSDIMKKMVKILLLLLFIGIIIFIVININKDKSKPINKPLKKEKKLQIIDLDSNSRPYAVMINNIDKVWGYQSGIQDAYIVYEILVEGGYTRLMALFKDKNLDRIGSVRSSRHYFLDYALENDAIYVHFGWSPQAESDIKTLNIDNINFLTYGSGYERDFSLGLASEHTAFTSSEKITKGIENFKYRNTSNQDTLLNYSVDNIDLSLKEGAILANDIYIQYSNNKSTSYKYDNENKLYKRFQNNIEHKDYKTNNQYTAKNIIVYQVDTGAIANDTKNRQEINNIGSGNGYYISNGYAVPITWTKTSRSSQTKYKYLDGEEIKVNDGNTFIQIQPSNKNLTIN